MTPRRPGASGAAVGLALALALALASCAPDAGGGGGRGNGADSPVAPDFTLLDLEGRPVSLADFRGKTVVIDFWATWCPPCIFQVPELNEFWRDHRESGEVVVLGVAVDVDGAEAVAPWVAEQNVEYAILIGDENLAREFGAMGFPTVAIVTPDGRLDSLHVGLIEKAELEEIVAPLRALGST
jgi:thiol-disulfide isomerase/thioredoxin